MVTTRADVVVATTRAELLKLVTLPALPLTVVLTWAFTGLLRWAATADPVDYARAGFLVLGVLAATSEYDSGQIRVSLLCTPRRPGLQVARAVALALAVTPVAAGTVLIAGAGNPGYLVLLTLLAAGAGTLLRRAVPALVVLLGWYFVLGPFLRHRFDDGLWLPGLWTAAVVLSAGVAVSRRDG